MSDYKIRVDNSEINEAFDSLKAKSSALTKQLKEISNDTKRSASEIRQEFKSAFSDINKELAQVTRGMKKALDPSNQDIVGLKRFQDILNNGRKTKESLDAIVNEILTEGNKLKTAGKDINNFLDPKEAEKFFKTLSSGFDQALVETKKLTASMAELKRKAEFGKNLSASTASGFNTQLRNISMLVNDAKRGQMLIPDFDIVGGKQVAVQRDPEATLRAQLNTLKNFYDQVNALRTKGNAFPGFDASQWLSDADAAKLLNKVITLKNSVESQLREFEDGLRGHQKEVGQSVRNTQESIVKARQMFMAAFSIGFTTIMPFRNLVKQAGEAEKALLSLGREARANNISGDKAIESVRNMKIVENGVVSLGAAARAVKLAMRIGFDATEAKTAVEQMTEIAIENKQAALTLDMALVNAFEGFKQELSQLADAAGVTKNISIIYKEYADMIGKGALELSKKEKKDAIQIELNREHAKSVGALADSYDTLSGASDRTLGNFRILQQELGIKMRDGIISIYSSLTSLLQVIRQVVSILPSWASSMGIVTAAIVTISSIVIVLTTGIGSLIAAFGHMLNTFALVATQTAILIPLMNALNISASAALSSGAALFLGIKAFLGVLGIGAVFSAIAYAIYRYNRASEEGKRTTSELKKEYADIRAEIYAYDDAVSTTATKIKRFNEELKKEEPSKIVINNLKNQILEKVRLADVSERVKMRLSALVRDQGIDEQNFTNILRTETEERKRLRESEFKTTLQANINTRKAELASSSDRGVGKSSGLFSSGDLNSGLFPALPKHLRFRGADTFNNSVRGALAIGENERWKQQQAIQLSKSITSTPASKILESLDELTGIFSADAEKVQQAKNKMKEFLSEGSYMLDDEFLQSVVTYWKISIDDLIKLQNEIKSLEKQYDEAIKPGVNPVDKRSIDKILKNLQVRSRSRFLSDDALEKLLRGDGSNIGAVNEILKAIKENYAEGLAEGSEELKLANEEGEKVASAFSYMAELIIKNGDNIDRTSKEFEEAVKTLEGSKVPEPLDESLNQISNIMSRRAKATNAGTDPVLEIAKAASTKGFNVELLTFAMAQVKKKYEESGIAAGELTNTVESEANVTANLFQMMTEAGKKKNTGMMKKLETTLDLVDSYFFMSDAMKKVKHASSVAIEEEKAALESILQSPILSVVDKIEAIEEIEQNLTDKLIDAGEARSKDQKLLFAKMQNELNKLKEEARKIKSETQSSVEREFNDAFNAILNSTKSVSEKIEAIEELRRKLDLTTSDTGSNSAIRKIGKLMNMELQDLKEALKTEKVEEANAIAENTKKKYQELLSTTNDIKALRQGIATLKSEMSSEISDAGLSSTSFTRSVDRSLGLEDKRLDMEQEQAESFLKSLEKQVAARERTIKASNYGQTELEIARVRQAELSEIYSLDLEAFGFTALQKAEIEQQLSDKMKMLSQEVADAKLRHNQQVATRVRELFVSEFTLIATEGKKLKDVLFDIFKTLVHEMLRTQAQAAMKSSIFEKIIGGLAGGLSNSISSSGSTASAAASTGFDAPTTNVGAMGQQWYNQVFNISTIDSKSFSEYMTSNKDTLVGITSRENRKYELRATER